jgi:hypothetical protein
MELCYPTYISFLWTGYYVFGNQNSSELGKRFGQNGRVFAL